MFFHIPGLVLLWNRNIHAKAGTKMIEKRSVERIPTTRVSPTERIGAMLTMLGAIRTEHPTIVVNAERKTATPVELAIAVTQRM